ncbi:MAG: sulfurtransferase [Bacteroidetes bacterium]|nr:MAG: sulfurtransferase [Bacteroidota bacterium]
MGPLIANGYIDPAWNNVIALLVGIAFGYILEASGFSSSRKLAGVFYGYDFVVIRGFMTAVMVAMIGLIYFSYMGWIDLGEIFILPTFMTSIIVGGIIMGLGFVLGGYCPGTSFTGVAIGKLDAVFFTGGLYLGIFIFSMIFPWVEKIYYGGEQGPVTVMETFGISRGLFAFLFVIATLMAFFVASIVKKKVKNIEL